MLQEVLDHFYLNLLFIPVRYSSLQSIWSALKNEFTLHYDLHNLSGIYVQKAVMQYMF